jgi:Rha family phage regulatory protein
MQELMSSEVKTMSSVDIAELVGKRHDNVMSDIKSLVKQGAIGALNFQESSYISIQNKKIPMYNLDYEATMVLITGYDAKRRSMVIKRWIALEKGEAVSAVSMKKEELELRLIAGKYAAEMEMVAVQSAATFLRVSDSSKLEMMHIVFEGNGVKTTALPQFTEKVRTVCSATHLLEQNNCPIKVRAFNAALIKHGFLEKLKRLATQRTFKTYNSLTEKGLQYGQNDAYKRASTQTQAHLYSDTFMELYERVVK